MEHISQKQAQLFEDIIKVKHDIQNLAGYVQNDFDTMIKDGSVTKEEIKLGIKDVNDDFNRILMNLQILQSRCEELIESL
jgi:hypothetical protein